jgi:integrase/recombinase XerD
MEEVGQLLAAAKPGRERMLLETAYGCGLRISELLGLQVTDIDASRMVVTVRHGKGAKDRQVPLSARLLSALRKWWSTHRHPRWLFPGKTPGRPLSDGMVQRIAGRVVKRAGLRKKATLHTLRHSYATHLLEAGVDVVTLQKLLGHSDLSTTARYLHLSTRQMQKLPNVLDLLGLPKEEKKAEGDG